MIDEKEFREWLNETGFKPFMHREKGDNYIFIKMPKTDDIMYLYVQNQYNCSNICRRFDFEYVGMYNMCDGMIYDFKGYFCNIPQDIVYPKTVSSMAADVTREVREKVNKYIGNDKSKLNVCTLSEENQKYLENFLSYDINKKAEELYIEGTAGENLTYECRYKYDEWKEQDLIDCITNKDMFIEKEAKKYIESHQDDILLHMLQAEKLKEKLQELESVDDSLLKRLKNIISVVDGTSAKNVYVTISKNGAEFSFKMQTGYLMRNKIYSSWYMQPSDKLKFETLFGKRDVFTPEEIIDISYRGKSIYSAEPYSEQSEDQGITMGM